MATAPPRPDKGLLERLRERDRTAWEEIYRLYEGRLYGFAYRLTGNPHDAADLVQETFVRALPRLDRLPPDRADIAAYLFATAKNLFLKSVERSKRQQPVEEVPEPDEPAAIEDDPQGSALLRRQQEEVRIANGKLAPRQRLVLALRELEDKSYAEIGELVGLSENAVAQLILRARQSLREELRLVQVDRSKLSPECQEFLPLLSTHLDGQLKEPKLERTLAHVERCEACQSALADMHEASRRYRAVVPPLIGVAALKDSIDDALGAVGYWEGPARTGLGLRAALHGKALVVASVAGLALLGGLGGGLAVAFTGSGDASESAVGITTEVGGNPSQPSTVGPASETESSPLAVGESDQTTAATSAQAQSQTGETAAAGTEETVVETNTATTAAKTETAATEAAATGQTTTEPATTAEPQPAKIGAPTILSGPDDPTASTKATFRFTAEGAGSYRCRLDGRGYEPCSSPWGYAGLASGRHSFTVRAARGGSLGPGASYSWTISAEPVTTTAPPPTVAPPATTAPPADTTPPSVSIGGGPPGSTAETSARFTFSASEPSTFQCRLDGGAYESCGSPTDYAGLAAGGHTFSVRATDQAGNTGQPASHSWTITPPQLPDLVISNLTSSTVVVTNTGTAPAGAFVLSVNVPGGSFSIPGLAPGASATRSWSTCAVGMITAVADASGQVAESNEGNNSGSAPC